MKEPGRIRPRQLKDLRELGYTGEITVEDMLEFLNRKSTELADNPLPQAEVSYSWKLCFNGELFSATDDTIEKCLARVTIHALSTYYLHHPNLTPSP